MIRRGVDVQVALTWRRVFMRELPTRWQRQLLQVVGARDDPRPARGRGSRRTTSHEVHLAVRPARVGALARRAPADDYERPARPGAAARGGRGARTSRCSAARRTRCASARASGSRRATSRAVTRWRADRTVRARRAASSSRCAAARWSSGSPQRTAFVIGGALRGVAGGAAARRTGLARAAHPAAPARARGARRAALPRVRRSSRRAVPPQPDERSASADSSASAAGS